MNKKMFLTSAASLLLAGVFTLLSCSDAVVENNNSPIETKAKLTIKVQDAVTGEMLPKSAGVTVTFPEKKGKQLESGAFVYNDVYVGSYNIVVDAGDKYAIRHETVGIGARAQENVHIAYDETVVVWVYPLQSNLEGYVYYRNENGIDVAAEDVTVQLHFGGTCPLVKKIYDAKGKSDAEGKYVFEKLPAVPSSICSYTLYALGGSPKGSKLDFQTNTLTGGFTFALESGTTDNNAGTRVISPNNNNIPFVVTGYEEVIADADRSKPITFTFSDDIDEKSRNNTTVTFGTEVASVEWGTDNVKLTPAGRWEDDFTVTFSGTTLKSISGKVLPSGQLNYAIIVDKKNISDAEVTDIAVDNHFYLTGPTAKSRIIQDSVKETNTAIKLTWTKVEGADEGYKVFCKDGSMNNYVECGSTDAHEDSVRTTVTFASYPSTTNPNLTFSQVENRKIKFLVQAYNSKYKTLLKEENELEIKDVYPDFKSTSYTSATQTPMDKIDSNIFVVATKDLGTTGLDWTDRDTKDKTYEWIFTFGENMNITKALTLDVATINDASASAFAKIDQDKLKKGDKDSYEWTSKKDLTVRITLKKGEKATSALHAKLTITGLEDENGNKFESRFVDTKASNENSIAGTYKHTDGKWYDESSVKRTNTLVGKLYAPLVP